MHQTRNPHFCLHCDDGTVMHHTEKDLLAGDTVVPNISGWHCPVCGECEFDDGEGLRYSDALEAHRLRENAKN